MTKPVRHFDILNRASGDYIYDVPENLLSDKINDLLDEGYTLEELRITEDIFVEAERVRPVWKIVE